MCTTIQDHLSDLGGDEQVVAGEDDAEAGVAAKERGQHVNHSQHPPLRIAHRPIAIRELRRPSLAALRTLRRRLDERAIDNRNELATVIGYDRAAASRPRSSAGGRTRPALGHHALPGRRIDGEAVGLRGPRKTRVFLRGRPPPQSKKRFAGLVCRIRRLAAVYSKGPGTVCGARLAEHSGARLVP